MNRARTLKNPVYRVRLGLAALAGGYAFAVFLGTGCWLTPCGSFFAKRTFRGVVLRADSLAGLNGAMVSAIAYADGQMTGGGGISTIFGDNPLDETGKFEFKLYSNELGGSGGRCGAPPFFPPPDQLEIIVEHDGCEHRVIIDVNADTVVDPDIPDVFASGFAEHVIELKDPILVPPCEP